MKNISTEEWNLFHDRALAAKKEDDWKDGLGLESPVDRSVRMYTAACMCFQEQRKAGVPFHEACDIALGLVVPRANLTHLTKEGVTPPAKDKANDV